MKKSKSSGWVREHEDDEYVKRARREGYRSRASYKLLEMDERYRLLRPGNCVVDLGAAPGGWSQVAAQKAGRDGKVIALDLLPMAAIDSVVFIQGDMTEADCLERLLAEIATRPVNLVISDMAPNLSGVKDIDQPRSAYLAELALDLVDRVLSSDGKLVIKCFEGAGIDEIRSAFRERFARVINFKPKASRGRSREIYLIGCRTL
jgi:23S rRNA (uridine2552-2'-O)-methyltransferase